MNLSRPTLRQLEALNALKASPGWEEGINQIFAAELSAVQDKLVGATDEVTLRQLQGSARLIKAFQLLVLEAQQRAEVLRAPSAQ